MKRLSIYSLPSLLCFVAFAANAAPPSEPEFESVQHTSFFSMLKQADRAAHDKDSTDVFALQQRLACAGNQANQAVLGGLYLNGRGVVEDDITGYSWLKLASESGVPAYRDLVKSLEKGMTPAQRTLADSRVEKLKAQYGTLATHMSCAQVDAPGSHMKQLVCNPARVDPDAAFIWLKRCEK